MLCRVPHERERRWLGDEEEKVTSSSVVCMEGHPAISIIANDVMLESVMSVQSGGSGYSTATLCFGLRGKKRSGFAAGKQVGSRHACSSAN